MSRACQGLSHDYTGVEGGGGGGLRGAYGAWDQAEKIKGVIPAAASDGTIAGCRKSKFKTD